ncbi:MAG: formylglycine-generating enzyme family protein [Crocinitomicaceae bacterium]|nr:formylglycine-generating enzyme family protein [Crocinitomicaceae bacterium]
MKFTFILTTLSLSAICLSLALSPKKAVKKGTKALNDFCGYIPSGKVEINSDTISVQAFYMSKTEITNHQYKEFLADLLHKGEISKFEKAKIDSIRWNEFVPAGNSYSKYYHSHPAYDLYPVVNISKEGAELFCDWLSAKYDSLFEDTHSLKFRVPTRAEWLKAANGESLSKLYSWGGPLTRNAKGSLLANFLRVGAENVTRNESTGQLEVVTPIVLPGIANSEADVLAPATSYFPNDFGIFNLNGNASEMISDGDFAVGGDWKSPGYDIRNISIKPTSGPSPVTGFRVVATYIAPKNI